MHELAAGIVGLPNAGKSTLFNSLVHGTAAVAPYPFCTIEPNVGVVPIPDPRLLALAKLVQPEKVTPATVRFIDIAGLVKNASRGEGLGNQFLAHIREVEAIVHVIRGFASGEVAHVYATLDPVRDAEIVETELLLADLETVRRRKEKLERQAKSRDPKVLQEKEWTARLVAHLSAGRPARTFPLETELEQEWLRGLFLLSAKPMIYVFNLSEGEWIQLSQGSEVSPLYRDFCRWVEARPDRIPVVPVAAALEETLSGFTPEEARQLREAMGLPSERSSGLERLLQAVLAALDLVTFYTVKGVETRAWLVRRGTKAPQAAGEIHSDMERGFIRAEVVTVDELLHAGGFAAARERGLVRSEGRDYQVRDGDVILFRFAA